MSPTATGGDTGPAPSAPAPTGDDNTVLTRGILKFGVPHTDPPSAFYVPNGTQALHLYAYLNSTSGGPYVVTGSIGTGFDSPALGLYSPLRHFPGPAEIRIEFSATAGNAGAAGGIQGPFYGGKLEPAAGEWEAHIFGMGSNVQAEYVVRSGPTH